MKRRWLKAINSCAYLISAYALLGWAGRALRPLGALSDGEWSLAGNWEGREVKRITSPDNPYSRYRFDAVRVDGSAGATTTEVSRIYIVPKGELPQLGDHPSPCQFQADHVEGLDFSWVNPRLLEIRYKEARIDGFSNHWVDWSEPGKWSYVIETRLKPLNEKWSLNADDRNMPRAEGVNAAP